MKIVIFLNNSHNIVGRAYKETVSLSRAGHVVTVLAKYNGDLPTEEIIGGATVRRLIIWPETRIPIIKQIIFSYRWIRAGLDFETDVYQVADADTLFEATICAVLKRKKLIYDSYELFLNIVSLEHATLSRLYWWIKEYIGVYASDCVIATNDERAKIMRARYPFAEKIEVIENFPNKIVETSELYEKNRHDMREKLGIGQKTVFVFQGFLNRNRGLEELFEAFQYCKKMNDIAFVIIGKGDYKDRFEQLVADKKYTNVICTGKVNYLELSTYLSMGDVGMVFYPPICLNYVYAAPNKLYEYMMNGMAVLSNNTVTISRVIDAEKSGLWYADGAKGLAEKIDYMAEHTGEVSEMKKRGYDAVMQKYNWEYQEEKFLNIYKNV